LKNKSKKKEELRILILGATKGVGFYLLKYFNSIGIFTIGLGRQVSNINVLYEISLSQTDQIKDLINDNRINIIIHLVSGLRPSSNGMNFIDEIDNVIQPSSEIFKFSHQNNIKVIFISSAGVIYDESELIFNEKSVLNPKSFYGASKLMLENHIKSIYKKSSNYLILRPTNIVNEIQDYGIFGAVANSAHNKQTFTIYGNSKKDYIHIENFSQILHELILNDVCDEILNVGSGYSFTANEIIEEFERQLNLKINICLSEKKNYDYDRVIINIERLNFFVSTNFKRNYLEHLVHKFIL
jgi:UDP-glucose 4-epimerase